MRQLAFTAKMYPSISFGGLDMVPWGFRKVHFRLSEIIIRGQDGLCGIPTCTVSTNVVIAAEHSLFLHVRADPIEFTAGYTFLAEAVLLYSLCVAAKSIIMTEIGDYYSLAIVITWFAFRFFVMMVRRRAHVFIKALGQPAPTWRSPAKTRFPIPITEAERCVEAFLFSRGAGSDSEQYHRWKKKILGYGIIPRGCGCEGYHTLQVSESHFRIDKVNGGGTNEHAYGCCNTKEHLVGPIQIINWVHVHKAGKSLIFLLTGLVTTAFVTGLIALVTAILWPKCETVDVCDLIHSPDMETVVSRINVELNSGRCDSLCSKTSCVHLQSLCRSRVEQCDFENNMVCDEPHLCPMGSDTADCRAMHLVQNSTGFEKWLTSIDLDTMTNDTLVHLSSFGTIDVSTLRDLGPISSVDEMVNILRFNASLEQSFRAAIEQLNAVPTAEAALYHLSAVSIAPFLNSSDGSLDLQCPFANDGKCDEGTIYCPLFSDGADCDDRLRQQNRISGFRLHAAAHPSPFVNIVDLMMDDYDTYCDQTRIIYHCSGCSTANSSNDMTTFSNSDSWDSNSDHSTQIDGGPGCASIDPQYPNAKQVCKNIEEAGNLPSATTWCAADNFPGKPPCSCFTWYERLEPNVGVLTVVWSALWVILATLQFVRWIVLSRGRLTVGVVGVDHRKPDHAAELRVDTKHIDSIPPLLFQKKLARPLRETLIKSWKRRFCGMHEELVLFRDHILMRARNMRPFCCTCSSCLHQEDEYYILLRDVHFVETGIEGLPSLRMLARLVLVAGVALHLSVFVDGIISSFQDNKTAKALLPTEITGAHRWSALGASIALCLAINYIAGCLKRHYLHLGCFPEDYQRGRTNTFGGQSPFYIKLPLRTNVESFDQFVTLIRTAAKESKQHDQAHATQQLHGEISASYNNTLEHHGVDKRLWSVRHRVKIAVAINNWYKAAKHVRKAWEKHADYDPSLSAPISGFSVPSALVPEDNVPIKIGDLNKIDGGPHDVLHRVHLQVDEVGLRWNAGAKNRDERKSGKNQDFVHLDGFGQKGIIGAKDMVSVAICSNETVQNEISGFVFEVRSQKLDPILFSADSEEERQEWIAVIETAIAHATNQQVIKSGILLKLGGVQKNKWQNRYITVDADGVTWSLDEKGSSLGVVSAHDLISVCRWSSNDNCNEFEFEMIVKKGPKRSKSYYFASKTAEDRDEWIEAIDAIMINVVEHAGALSGNLRKFGGVNKNELQIRHVTVNEEGIIWSKDDTKSSPKTFVKSSDVISVAKWADDTGLCGFVLRTHRKGGKSLRFVTSSEELQSKWLRAIEATMRHVVEHVGGLSGKLMKLGGKSKNTWQPRSVRVDERGIMWSKDNEKATKHSILADDVLNVSAFLDSDDGEKLCRFEVQSNRKGGKSLLFKAPSAEACQKWIKAMAAITPENRAKFAAAERKRKWEQSRVQSIRGRVAEHFKKKGKHMGRSITADADDEIATLQDAHAKHTEARKGKLNLNFRLIGGKHIAEIATEGHDGETKRAKVDVGTDDQIVTDPAVLLNAALKSCFKTFDVERTGWLTLDQVYDALDALGLSPTEDMLTGLLAEFAEESEEADGEVVMPFENFILMMNDFIHEEKAPPLDYEGAVFCPFNTFGLDFDFLPWGKRKTLFRGNKIDVSSSEGMCGMTGTSDVSNTSLETEKSRWLHMEGNPAPSWKLNAYLAESLVIYTLLSAWDVISENVMNSDLLVWSVAIVWWISRTAFFVLRRRGVGVLFTYGNPVVGGVVARNDSLRKGVFSVPLRYLADSIDAFLTLKGISKKDVRDHYVKNFPAYNFLPQCCCGCAAKHELKLGSVHYEIDKTTNQAAANFKCARYDYFAGLVADVRWIAVHKWGKNFRRLLSSIVEAVLSGIMIALMVGTQTYGLNCSADLDIHDTLGTNASSGVLDDRQQSWCSAFRWSRTQKPGWPCLCTGGTSCNPLLDPMFHQVSPDRWCDQFDALDPSWLLVQADEKRPCSCVPWYMKVQYLLLLTIVAVVSAVLSIGIIYVWMVVTPLWIEFAVHGVDNRQPGHLAAARIHRKHRKHLPMTVMTRKLRRPLRETLLKEWSYHPPCYNLVRGLAERMRLHADYIHLQTTDGVPFCCMRHGLCALGVDEDDYYVLLRDVTFLETGFEYNPVVADLGTLLLVIAIVTLIAGIASVTFAAQLDVDIPDWIFITVFSVDLGVWLLLYAVKSKLKKPFIHVGVTPGGSERGRANRYGGNSPFYIRLRSSLFAVNFEKIKDLIRSAKLASLQEDALTIADTRRRFATHNEEKEGQRRMRVRSRFKTLKPVQARQALAVRLQKDAETMNADMTGVDTSVTTGDVLSGQAQDEVTAQLFKNAGNVTDLAEQGLTGAGLQGAQNAAAFGANQVQNVGALLEGQAGLLLSKMF
eukprot:SAG31_NODE_1083_length_10012_cov_5.562796_2_plen_2400_part_00